MQNVKFNGDKVTVKCRYLQRSNFRLQKLRSLIDGGYDGKTVVLGIRPEDVHDEPDVHRSFSEYSNRSYNPCIRNAWCRSITYTSMYEGANMTARVDPRTTARNRRYS